MNLLKFWQFKQNNPQRFDQEAVERAFSEHPDKADYIPSNIREWNAFHEQLNRLRQLYDRIGSLKFEPWMSIDVNTIASQAAPDMDSEDLEPQLVLIQRIYRLIEK